MDNNKGRLATLLRCCMCIGGAMGMVSNCIGIYFTPLAKALDIGVGRISVIVTLISLGNAFFAPFFVRLRKRFPLNRIMAGGIILCILAYLLLSVAGSIWTLYLCGILFGIGMCNFSALPVTLILRDWYGDKNGSAVGAALAFSGVFGAVMNPILSRLISSLSYQTSLRLMA
ncbi:MAG: MFS transporter, partial [Solobacterium sp.]|nr:MFS transporter [Solobacterium sp.]